MSDGNISPLHLSWEAILTMAGAVMAFFLNRYKDDLKDKVSKDVFEAHREAAETDLKDLKEQFTQFNSKMDAYHLANTSRIDNLVKAIYDTRTVGGSSKGD